MAMERHITRAELARRVSGHRASIRSLNAANVDTTPDGGTLSYFALDDIVLIGPGHDTVSGWLAMCDDANDGLIGGKITVAKAGRFDSGTLTLTHKKASSSQRGAIEKEIKQFSKKEVKWVAA